MSTILVAGGAGYVGCHTVLELLQKGFKVVVVDSVESCQLKKPETLLKVEKLTGKETTFYNYSIDDEDALSDLFSEKKINCVIHLASIKNCTQNPLEFYRNDVGGSLCLLETMKKYGVRKIVFSSTVYVYGEPDFLPITEEHDTGYKLSNVFTKSKYMIEEALKDLCQSDPEWTAVILRHTNPVGAHESGLIGEKWIKNQVTSIARHVALGHEKIYVYREEYENLYEEGMVDYIHVSDVANAYVLATNAALSIKSFIGIKIYNLGADRPTSIVNVIEKISVLSGKPLVYEIVEKGKAEQPFYVSAKLIQEELGWKRRKNFEDICRDTLKWVMANKSNLIPIILKSDSFLK